MSNISFQKPDGTNLEVQLFDKYLVLRLYLPLAGTAAVMLDFSKIYQTKHFTKSSLTISQMKSYLKK